MHTSQTAVSEKARVMTAGPLNVAHALMRAASRLISTLRGCATVNLHGARTLKSMIRTTSSTNRKTRTAFHASNRKRPPSRSHQTSRRVGPNPAGISTSREMHGAGVLVWGSTMGLAQLRHCNRGRHGYPQILASPGKGAEPALDRDTPAYTYAPSCPS